MKTIILPIQTTLGAFAVAVFSTCLDANPIEAATLLSTGAFAGWALALLFYKVMGR